MPQQSVNIRLSKEQKEAWEEVAEGPLSTWVRDVVCREIGREDLLQETEATKAARALRVGRAEETATCDRRDCATTRAALYDARQRLLLFERFLGQVETYRHTYDELADVGRALLQGDRSPLEKLEWRPVEGVRREGD